MGASLVARARVLELQGTVVAVSLAVLQHAGSYFPDQGSNLSLLHWRAGSLPLNRLESPLCIGRVLNASVHRVIQYL